MTTPGTVLSYEEFMRCERISSATLFRWFDAGELVRCKTGARLANGKNEQGIPAWCLSRAGQEKLLKRTPKIERPALRAFLEGSTNGVRGSLPDFPERALDLQRRAEARGD